MNYTITEQYAKGEERILAEFDEWRDASLFITKKAAKNEEEKKKALYRLYHEDDLVQELNKESISTGFARYAEGNGDLDNPSLFSFQVLLIREDLTRTLTAQFINRKDCLWFITIKFKEEGSLLDNETFLIMKDQILFDTINKSIIKHWEEQSDSSRTGDNSSAYKLSPLSTRPTPQGGPADYWVKNDDQTEDG